VSATSVLAPIFIGSRSMWSARGFHVAIARFMASGLSSADPGGQRALAAGVVELRPHPRQQEFRGSRRDAGSL
jgi:hypothetical protein